MKTYQITLSKVFPSKHPRHGQPTEFRELYEDAIKLHTIRANFPHWKGRFEYIYINEGILSIRQWSGKPYASKQELITNLCAADRIGLQELVFVDGDINRPHIVKEPDLFNPERTLIPVDIYDLATNDGLTIQDWLDWFKGYDLTESMAVIQFTGFRYH
ncbi:MAG: hypothetical protein IKH61_13000 [Bacteroidales bacterium]|nr:hypothetical protein [Bacteroidales bacterium]